MAKSSLLRKKEPWPTVTEVAEKTLNDISKIIDNKKIIKEFNKLQKEGNS